MALKYYLENWFLPVIQGQGPRTAIKAQHGCLAKMDNGVTEGVQCAGGGGGVHVRSVF